MDSLDRLFKADPEVAEAINDELNRQQHNIELIASENIVSKASMLAMGTVLTNKYAEGYPGKRHYGGCQVVDKVETLAIERICQLFGAEYANVQPHSGAQANFAGYKSLIKPGDTILSLSLDNGGHLTHGSSVNFSGQLYNMVFYDVIGAAYVNIIATILMTIPILFIGWVIIKVIKFHHIIICKILIF